MALKLYLLFLKITFILYSDSYFRHFILKNKTSLFLSFLSTFSAFLFLCLFVFLWPKTGVWSVCNLLCHKCTHTWPMHSCISYLFYCCFCLFCCYFVLYSKRRESLSLFLSVCFFSFPVKLLLVFPIFVYMLMAKIARWLAGLFVMLAQQCCNTCVASPRLLRLLFRPGY